MGMEASSILNINEPSRHANADRECVTKFPASFCMNAPIEHYKSHFRNATQTIYDGTELWARLGAYMQNSNGEGTLSATAVVMGAWV